MNDANNANMTDVQNIGKHEDNMSSGHHDEIVSKEKAKKISKGGKRRISVAVSPENEKLMKLLITELGFDSGGMNASERVSALFELALLVLEAEMEMARISTNQRFIDESTLKDYITRKYAENVNNVRPAPLFE